MRRSAQTRRLVAAALSLGGASHCGAPEEGGGGSPSYQRLSETGLYADMATRQISDAARPFAPAFALWSDGADKARWLMLPPGSSIDTSDIDHWIFPIGTRLFKEFSRAGKPLETRLIERFGPERDDYWMGAFLWNEDGSDAQLVPEGASDVLGTAHDVPAAERCPACHNGEPGRTLGFSALQLAGTPDGAELTLERLTAEGLLSTPPADAPQSPPGDALASAALGYLHANCGHCHNPRGTAWPDTQMLLRLDVAETLPGAGVETSGSFQSVVREPLQYFRDDSEAIQVRVAPGHPELSGIIARMNVRGPMEQMPPLATEVVDDEGVGIVSRWIESLPE